MYDNPPDPIFNKIQNSEIINTPKALHSLCMLTCYKINIHFSQENDQTALEVRHSSRQCLQYIQMLGDASVYTELTNVGYVGVLVIAISTASGSGEEENYEIRDGLGHISSFLGYLHQGRYNSATFPPQPLLALRAHEQLEEEGGNEEIDSQLINEGLDSNIKNSASRTNGWILNHFIEQGNLKPDQQ
ncbi:MAG: hypothetical protein EZS28_002315 [Streblomastix strix]|uniref:Uncharacterized protein n=1 Tax=Streblomastix strix TaxID=222440 RepID=A0A5J4X585_9EUKA|nr:MAG: hypothetical protein EZS28_002315 [Streblomastix strix]